ncbi:MAG TPA: hypothetical protein VF798_06560 [Burkholderiaceae bacterium]
MDGNVSGKAYALTILSPIKNGHVDGRSCGDVIRDQLESWNMLQNSPMARVPQTYLARFFVLDDVFTESLPGANAFDTMSDFLPVVPDSVRRFALPSEGHLKSKYLVFSSDFHGDLDMYLQGMWQAIAPEVQSVWQHCYGFDAVKDAAGFAAYMKRCQLGASLFFVGSNDEPLEAQLKALYLKQEFSRFALESQGLPTAELKARYQEFIARVKPRDLAGPSWEPGQYSLLKHSESQQEAAL